MSAMRDLWSDPTFLNIVSNKQAVAPPAAAGSAPSAPDTTAPAAADGDQASAAAAPSPLDGSAGPQATNAGNPANAGSNKAPQTNDSGLVGNGTAGIHDAAGNDVADPKPDVDYDFYAVFENKGKLPSGPCFVLFTLSGDKDWSDKCDLDDGLKAGAMVEASVTFGRFPVPETMGSYRLKACIFSKAAPDNQIACVGEFGILVEKP